MLGMIPDNNKIVIYRYCSFFMHFISISTLGSSKITHLHVMYVKIGAPGDFFENSTWYLSVSPAYTSFINCQFSG